MGKAVISYQTSHLSNYQDIIGLSGYRSLYKLEIMIIAKLVLFALPVLVASMLFLANPAAATLVNASATTHISAADSQSVHQSVTLNQVDSNPIIDQLGCQCAYCVGAKSQLQGKLPISNI